VTSAKIGPRRGAGAADAARLERSAERSSRLAGNASSSWSSDVVFLGGLSASPAYLARRTLQGSAMVRKRLAGALLSRTSKCRVPSFALTKKAP
jgi:hypothetical protein